MSLSVTIGKVFSPTSRIQKLRNTNDIAQLHISWKSAILITDRADKTKLSSSTTVFRYRELEAANNRDAIGAFLRERFDERYFKPVADSPSKHGFAIMAIACLAIETLESFYQGLGDTRNKSTQMFRDFFARDTPLKVFADGNDWFFRDIRCGILHQAEAKAGWHVLRSGPLLDKGSRTINATQFLREVQKAVENYTHQIRTCEKSWNNLKLKMNTICVNCT